VISSVSTGRCSSSVESPAAHKAYEEVDCSSFWRINVREVNFSERGEVGLAIQSSARDTADTMSTYRSFSQTQQLLSSGPPSTR
jgi:hypothetical protein